MIRRFVATGALATVIALAAVPAGKAAAAGPLQLEEPPRYGTFYERWEPSFYTGFAPRIPEPGRLHIHIGRGNQIRVTAVLSDEVLDGYAADLLARRRIYRRLVEAGDIEPTQNDGLAVFDRTLAAENLEQFVLDNSVLEPVVRRERNLYLMERLNPGRVFRIRIPVDRLVRHWIDGLEEVAAEAAPTADRRRLDVLAAMLPTRLWPTAIDGETAAALDALVRSALDREATGDPVARIRADFLALLERVSGGLYPVRGRDLVFAEFTALYPIGTWNQTTNVNGRPIPAYPTPGRRALTTHQRTKTIDHIPTDMSYSLFPWLPYMHVGTRLHNSLHTLWWRFRPARTAFLPDQWKAAADPDGPDGERQPREFLWLLSRGPMSHGCTHMTGGHISELRQMLPAMPEDMDKVDVWYNKTRLYDVFDLDGDLEPEVMGVRYFIAFSLQNKVPHRLRVRNERTTYYDWLYGGDLALGEDGSGRFARVRDGRFVGRSAVDGLEYEDLPLHEADYEPERLQFYRNRGIPFARELRRVGAAHDFDAAAVEADPNR